MTFERNAIWRSSGLKISCETVPDQGVGSRLLRFEDLNPEVEMQNVMTRWELFRIGFWMMCKAGRP